MALDFQTRGTTRDRPTTSGFLVRSTPALLEDTLLPRELLLLLVLLLLLLLLTPLVLLSTPPLLHSDVSVLYVSVLQLLLTALPMLVRRLSLLDGDSFRALLMDTTPDLCASS